MRTEAILLIGRNCFEMWWPGTELNRRRQPFQGCALPPELPGHLLVRTSPSEYAQSAKRLAAEAVPLLLTVLALSLGGMPRSKTADALGPCGTSNYNNPAPFPQNVADDFFAAPFLADFFSVLLKKRAGRWLRHS